MSRLFLTEPEWSECLLHVNNKAADFYSDYVYMELSLQSFGFCVCGHISVQTKEKEKHSIRQVFHEKVRFESENMDEQQ